MPKLLRIRIEDPPRRRKTERKTTEVYVYTAGRAATSDACNGRGRRFSETEKECIVVTSNGNGKKTK